MVSPCKKKSDKKGKSPKQNKGSLSAIRKGSKPLSGKKFYLDIRNQSTSRKLEEQITSLGGGVETFLVGDVSYLVTDRKSTLTNGSSPHPLSASSPSPSDAAPLQTRTRTRGEAMLYRVKQESVPTHSVEDIFEKASVLGIPVYPLVRFTEYIAKLLRRVEKVSSGNCTPRELRGAYLKLETGLRPELRVLSGGWPKIDLSKGSQGASAFASPQHDTNNSSRMTRKSGSKLLAAHNKNSSSGGPGGGAGYCEVCKVNYSWLEDHLSSVSHIKAVTDPTQYQELDSLISSSGWNGQRKSLRIKSPPPYSSPPTPTPLNCNGHINNHQTPLTNGTNIIRRSSDRKSPRRCRVSRKRLSAEEKLIEDNRAYYKVEVLNSKLRSTGTLQRQLGSSSCDSGEEENSNSSSNHMGSVLGATSLLNGQPNQTNEESVVVRLKKVRKSELSMLNDEAENFMFGDKKEDDDKTKRRDINNDTDYYKVELPSSRLRLPTSTKEEPQSRLKFNKSPPFDDSSSIRLRSAGGKSPPKEETVNHRLRSNKSPSDDHYRLRIKEEDKVNEVINHRLRSGGKSPKEEEQIHHRLRSSRHPEDDNRTSPETNHPRLRSGGGTPPPEPKLRSCPGLSPIKELTVERLCPPSEDDHCPEITLTHADITFAFELNNTEGVWSQVRDRLDNFKEELLPHHYSYPKVVLPAEMPYLERLKMLTRRRRRLSRCLDDKPRKSPRCHASTLAILSSVLPKSKLAEQPTSGVSSTPSSVNNPCPEDEETTASTMTVESNGSDSNTDSKALLQRFMQHFASLVDSAQPKATSPRPHETDESEELDTKPSNMDFLEMLSNDDCPLMDTCVQESMFNLRSFDTSALDSCNSSDCSEIFGFSEDGRSCFGRRRKKKRHNLTGWPKEKPRRKFMAYARKPRFLKSEPSIIHTDVDTESSAVLENFVLSLNERRNEMSPNSKRRGRPRMYPPGMSPSSIRNKLARENVLRRSSSISPLKSKPSLKLHPL